MSEHKSVDVLLLAEKNNVIEQLLQCFDMAESMSFAVTQVASMMDLLSELKEKSYQVILFDIDLSHGHGVDITNKIKEVTEDTPMIALIDLDNELLSGKACNGLRLDYLVKGYIDSPILVRTIALSIERARLDLAQERLNTEQARLGLCDRLTGLPNLLLFQDRAEQTASYAKSNDTDAAAILIDFDKFHDLFEVHGEEVCNKLIIKISERLSDLVKAPHTVGHLGGDEFAIIFSDTKTHIDIAHFARNIQEQIAPPFIIDSKEILLTMSMGINLFRENDFDFNLIMDGAEKAVMRAKEKGRDQFQFTNTLHQHSMMDYLHIEEKIKAAFYKNQFELFYQPQIDVKEGKTVGLEALLRLRESDAQMLCAAEFMPYLASAGVLPELTSWILKKICMDALQWRDEGHSLVPIAMNVTGSQLYHDNFVSLVSAILKQSHLDPHWIEFELNERDIMRDQHKVIGIMHELRDIGIKLSIDDYGTDHSSLTYLNKMPLDKLKIDKNFLGDFIVNPEDAGLVKAAITMAQCLQYDVVAMGVETNEQQTFLSDHGCYYMQGQLFHDPVPAVQVIPLLSRNWLLNSGWSDCLYYEDGNNHDDQAMP